MRVYPKEVKHSEDSNINSFEQTRKNQYDNRVALNRAFDEQVQAAEAAVPTDPMGLDPSHYEDFGDSVIFTDLDVITEADKVALLKKFYNPVKYKGVIFSLNGEIFALNSINCNASKRKSKLFDGEYAPSTRHWDIEARAEIKTWLKRHFLEYCTLETGLTAFEGAYNKAITSPHATCESETIRNCLDGFNKGKPFKREMAEIYYDKAVDYIRSLEYPRRKESALLTLLDKAVKFKSLSVGFGYLELMTLFRVNSRSTVSSWLKEFQADLIFVCTKRGSFNVIKGEGKTSKYRLMLPKDCYKVLDYSEINSD